MMSHYHVRKFYLFDVHLRSFFFFLPGFYHSIRDIYVIPFLTLMKRAGSVGFKEFGLTGLIYFYVHLCTCI